MKMLKLIKTCFLLIVTILSGLSAYCQNFVGVTKINEGQTIKLSNEQVLEIKLPCNPSTGFAWYPTLINTNVIKQTGDWDFISDQSSGIVGKPGTEIIRFIGVSEGTSELRLEYRRPWERNKPSIDFYKLTIISNGKYTGTYTPPVKAKPLNKQKSFKSPKSPSPLPSSFSWQPYCTPIKNSGSMRMLLGICINRFF